MMLVQVVVYYPNLAKDSQKRAPSAKLVVGAKHVVGGCARLSSIRTRSLLLIEGAKEPPSRLPLLLEKRDSAFLARKRVPKRKNRAPKEDGSLPEQIGHKSNTPKPNRTKSSLVSVKSRQIENQLEFWRAIEVRRSRSGGHRRSAMSDRRPKL
ncbi:hypothetical protein Acr_28g0009830 [Actinidia rufa]|uniref:Uncharacterized protein n=1 Tax=Actinidia rufa TaxID=165716 RepID=A0A7J0HB83_9ERIC|nr:hypothetical protein Acr_28g0009830 [Actinidia rufa]